MTSQSFEDYLSIRYPDQNSGTRSSYLNAIKILDEIFKQKDPFHLNSNSLLNITDAALMAKIIDYVVDEEDKYRNNQNSIFDLGKSTQTSYPRKRFCTAAIRRLGDYVNQISEATKIMNEGLQDGLSLSKDLLKKFNIEGKGTDRDIHTKQRIGQDIFRAMLMELYSSKCCLTGIDVSEVLRASHIIPWAENETTRLNPENGLCLSATYDAAFDRHLISFDEDYRLILSPVIKEAYTSDAFKTYFRNLEGKTISLPQIYKPSQEYLVKHRNKLIS